MIGDEYRYRPLVVDYMNTAFSFDLFILILLLAKLKKKMF